MIDWEYFTWRTITELIRHITFVFVVAFLIAITILHYDVFELIAKAINPTGLSNIFCSVLFFSVPIYFICVIIDSIDEVLVGIRGGYGNRGFFKALIRRIAYDATYIAFNFKGYVVVFVILIIISALGLIFLL